MSDMSDRELRKELIRRLEEYGKKTFSSYKKNN